MSMSILSQRGRKENNQSLSTLKGLKYKTHRVLKPVTSPNSLCFNDRQITEQLMEELTRIAAVIRDYEEKAKTYDLSFKEGGIVKELIGLEEIIHSKDVEIATITEEIKDLKSNKYSLDPLPKKEVSEHELFQLAEELKRQRADLLSVIDQHEGQVGKYQQMKNTVRKLQLRYMQKYSDRTISYQEFKQRRQENQRDQESRRKRMSRQQKTNHKERLDTSIENILSPRPQPSSKTLQEFQVKKTTAQKWLKKNKKKHSARIAQLTAQLQFVRDEDALLTEQIRQIQSQKSHLQAKFKYTRKRSSKYQGVSPRTTPFLSPSPFPL